MIPGIMGSARQAQDQPVITGDLRIAVMIDISQASFTGNANTGAGDQNSDGFSSTGLDTALLLVRNLANDLVANGRGSQPIGLIASGWSGVRATSEVTATDVVAAAAAGNLATTVFAVVGSGADAPTIPGTSLTGDTIDIGAGLMGARDYLAAGTAPDQIVFVLATTDGLSVNLSSQTPDPADQVFRGDPIAVATQMRGSGILIDAIFIRAALNRPVNTPGNPMREIDSDQVVTVISGASSVPRLYDRLPGSPPGVFGSGDWSVADAQTDGDFVVTVNILAPSPTLVTSIEISLDGGAWTPLGGAVAGTYPVSASAPGVAISVRLRAVSAAGPGPASTQKLVTPTRGYLFTRIRVPGTYAIDETNDDGELANHLQLSEVVFRAATGGAALTGTYAASCNPALMDDLNNVSRLTDGDPGTGFRQYSVRPYVQTLAGGHWIQIQHATPRNVREVVLTARTGTGDILRRAPSVMVVEASDDASAWTMVWGEVAIPTWSSGQARTFQQRAQAAAPKFYRVRCPVTRLGGNLGLVQMTWRAAGGAALTGGLYASVSINNATFDPSRAVDNNPSTFWTTGGNGAPAGGNFLALATYDQTSPVDVVLTVRPDTFREDPEEMVLERSLDGGLTWSTLATYTAIPAWSAGETRTFTL